MSERPKQDPGQLKANDNIRHRTRYRLDPEYRKRSLDYQRNLRAALRDVPQWMAVTNLRKKIHRARESYANQQLVLERMEKRLLLLGRDLVRAEKQWNAVREKLKRDPTFQAYGKRRGVRPAEGDPHHPQQPLGSSPLAAL